MTNWQNSMFKLNYQSYWLRKARFFVFLLLLLSTEIIFTRCTNTTVYDQIKPVEQPWKSTNPILFEVSIEDTISPMNFYLHVRNDIDYRYSNLFLFFQTTFPDKRIAVDTFNIWLAAPDGKWLGKGFGKYRDSDIIFKMKGRFPQKGIYSFKVEQAMRDVELSGIESIGIRIEYDQ
ncbi:MAG: gliding motility lipoprotein GldH [Bacteroidales bacterium]|nr:gliding motility lipoprotein GldH [Bacteroidales bacterium]